MRVIILARKPFATSAARVVITHNCGGLNIDGCRITSGRWPTNVILCGEEVVLDVGEQSGERPSSLVGSKLDPTKAHNKDYVLDPKKVKEGWGSSIQLMSSALYADKGTAARYFLQVGVKNEEVG